MIAYVSWPDTHSAPDWVRVPTIEVQGLPDADSPPQWAFTITQHPANQGTRTLPDQQPWERDVRRDQLRLNVFAE